MKTIAIKWKGSIYLISKNKQVLVSHGRMGHINNAKIIRVLKFFDGIKLNENYDSTEISSNSKESGSNQDNQDCTLLMSNTQDTSFIFENAQGTDPDSIPYTIIESNFDSLCTLCISSK